MRSRAVRVALVIAFAVCLGHGLWYGWLGPTPRPEYRVGGEVSVLTAPDGDAPQLYLRRQIFVSKRPRHAWIQLLGRDSVDLFVNGQYLGRSQSHGMPVANVVDLTSYLRTGVNTIAIAAYQTSQGPPPIVAVDGAYEQPDGEHRIQADAQWRCSTTFERGEGGWWFTGGFHDRGWPLVRLSRERLNGVLDYPPRTRTAPSAGHWIGAPALTAQRIAFRRDFEIAGRPREGWIRVTTAAPYRLAVNGVLLDQQEDQIGALRQGTAIRRIYDVTSLLQPGVNNVRLLLQNDDGPPHLTVDVEVEDTAGIRHRFDTDKQWLARASDLQQWLAVRDDAADLWTPCQMAAGDLGTSPWQLRGNDVQLVLSLDTYFWRAAGQTAVMGIVALLAALACRAAAYWLEKTGRASITPRLAADLAHWPLVLPAAALAGAFLLQFDPRITPQEVYRPLWLVLAILSVPLQWAVLGILTRTRRPVANALCGVPDAAGNVLHGVPDHTDPAAEDAQQERDGARSLQASAGLVEARLHEGTLRAAAAWGRLLTLAALVVIGGWLRLRQIPSEPLYPDEVTLQQYAQGWLTRAFPSMLINPDIPRFYNAGCELESFGTAAASLIFTRDVWVVRFFPVCYSIATIVAMYLVGRGMFNSTVGLVAATLYTFSPYCCEMSWFGRYEAQLQLLTLLTIYFFYRAVSGHGPLNRQFVGLTVLMFVGMFLSWEASSLQAVGLILFVLAYRWKRLGSVFGEPVIWFYLMAILTLVIVQQTHLGLQLRQHFIVGTGWGDLKLRPMWTFDLFKPWRFAWQSSWGEDSLLPVIGVGAATLLAIRHRWRRPLRLLVLSFFVTSLLWALTLPMIETYYSYSLVTLVILLSSAALVAGVEMVFPAETLARLPRGVAWYGKLAAAGVMLIAVGLGNGMSFDLREIPWQTVYLNRYGRYGQWKFPHLERPSAYIAAHAKPGDVVITLQPETFNHYAATFAESCNPPRPAIESDYATETVPSLYMLIPDHGKVLVHRTSATPVITSLADLEAIFARNRRVWYVTVASSDLAWNSPAFIGRIEDQMDVVYQDFRTVVLLRDVDRTASRRKADRATLHQAPLDLMPHLGRF
jgi:hypothetical protein